MMGVKMPLLVALMGVMWMAARSHRGSIIPGAPYNISRDDVSLQQIVLTATYSFNNQSNDAFLFRPSAIISALRQIVKGVKYFIDFQISRTVCHKRDSHKDLKSCNFQPEGVLQQTLQCHFEVWLIPWENITHTEVFLCES